MNPRATRALSGPCMIVPAARWRPSVPKADGWQDALAFLSSCWPQSCQAFSGCARARRGSCFPDRGLAYVPHAALPIVGDHPALLATHAEVPAAATMSLFRRGDNRLA